MSRVGHPRRDGEEGTVAIVVAFSMVMFLSILAAVLDSGQIFSARVILAAGTDAATLRAAEEFAEGGCAAFDTARSEAAAKLLAHAPTATLESFRVTYGADVVTAVGDCAAIAGDENVGRVDVDTSDTRPFAFAGFFTDSEGSTSAAAAAEWGYVTGLSGKVRPLSLCDQNTGYQNYLQYRAEQAAFEADPLLNPPPNPLLLTPVDIEIDGFEFSPCESDPSAQFGEFVLVDFGGDAAPASQAELREWLLSGAPDEVLLDDPSTLLSDERYCPGEDPDVLGACEGVTQAQSLDQVSDFLPVLGRTFSIMVHGNPVCDNGVPPPIFLHCDGGARGHRSYDVDGFVRVRVECLRISANDPLSSPVSAADDLAPGYCDTLTYTTTDGNPGDDVFVRLRFVVDTTIGEGRLSSDPSYDNGILGLRLCAVDGNDTCNF